MYFLKINRCEDTIGFLHKFCHSLAHLFLKIYNIFATHNDFKFCLNGFQEERASLTPTPKDGTVQFRR